MVKVSVFRIMFPDPVYGLRLVSIITLESRAAALMAKTAGPDAVVLTAAARQQRDPVQLNIHAQDIADAGELVKHVLIPVIIQRMFAIPVAGVLAESSSSV